MRGKTGLNFVKKSFTQRFYARISREENGKADRVLTKNWAEGSMSS